MWRLSTIKVRFEASDNIKNVCPRLSCYLMFWPSAVGVHGSYKYVRYGSCSTIVAPRQRTWNVLKIRRSNPGIGPLMVLHHWTNVSTHVCIHDVPAEMIYHHLINGRLRSARVDDVIETGRHSETYKLCEIRCKFNQLGLRLFKAYRRYISIILMYLKTNAIFRYRHAQIRTFQDKMRW